MNHTWLLSRAKIMVCSFCRSDKPRRHNVRTCPFLKAAIGVFIASKGAQMSVESFLQFCTSSGLLHGELAACDQILLLAQHGL